MRERVCQCPLKWSRHIACLIPRRCASAACLVDLLCRSARNFVLLSTAWRAHSVRHYIGGFTNAPSSGIT